MPILAVCLAVFAAALSVMSSPAFYLGLGMGIAATALGLVVWRRRGEAGSRRLLGAAAMTIGAIAMAMALARYGLVLVALDRMTPPGR